MQAVVAVAYELEQENYHDIVRINARFVVIVMCCATCMSCKNETMKMCKESIT